MGVPLWVAALEGYNAEDAWKAFVSYVSEDSRPPSIERIRKILITQKASKYTPPKPLQIGYQISAEERERVKLKLSALLSANSKEEMGDLLRPDWEPAKWVPPINYDI